MNFEMPQQRDEDLAPNMTPMIDVVFLLVVFFLVAAQLSVGASDDVELPLASEARRPDRMSPDTVTVEIKWVPGSPVFEISGTAYTYDDLLDKLRHLVDLARSRGRAVPPVILRADYRVRYGVVQKLMFGCSSVGVRVFDFQAARDEGGRS